MGHEPMCEDCEQGEALSVVYSRKLDRRGWRPPAKAATVARDRDDPQPGETKSFACEPSRVNARRRETP
jgi:hypothetical protein